MAYGSTAYGVSAKHETRNDGHSAYQQSEILDASPTRLIILLYRGAIEAIGRARKHLQNGDRRERSEQITRAFEILVELSASVDREKAREQGPEAGDLALRLIQLYDYMQDQLNRANLEQIAAPLDDVEKLLTSLLEGWEGAHSQLATSSVQQLSQFAEQSQGERRPLRVSA